MRHLKLDVWLWFVLAMALVGWAFARPMGSIAAPALQSTPTPRPTVSLPTFSSPVEGTPAAARIELSLAVDKAKARPGDTLLYKAQIANVAGQVATNVWLTCDLPQGVEVEKVEATQGQIYQYGQRIAVELGRLQAAYDSQFVTIKARVRDDVTPGSELVHRASLTSDQAGGGECEIRTMVAEANPTPTPTATAAVGALPTTGRGSLPTWLLLGLGGLIIAAALLTIRERGL